MTIDFNFYHNQLTDHVLKVICDHRAVKCYKLCRPNGSNMMSTYITFNPYNITLTGDLTPSTVGNCSQIGYGVEWFADHRTDWSYLVSKFDIRKGWLPDKATKHFRNLTTKEELVHAYGDENDVLEKYELAQGIERDILWNEGGFKTPEEYYSAMEHVFGPCWWDDATCEWYPDHEVGWLTAIQAAFAREYQKLEQKDISYIMVYQDVFYGPFYSVEEIAQVAKERLPDEAQDKYTIRSLVGRLDVVHR